jgi:FAD/FMN-containing dehydrogenase
MQNSTRTKVRGMVIERTEANKLQDNLCGLVILPDEEEYEKARKVYNGMIDRYPAMIVRCMDTADVIHSLHFARDHHLPLAVRGGGHSGPGLGVVDEGLVVDLSPMKAVQVDPRKRLAIVQGGATLGDLDHATHAYGLVTPTGFLSTTGVGGLTLGGGIGYLSRQHGLTIDNLEEVELVQADGHIVTANHEENQDLFWAVRGGGGNFGVVTSFTFRLHPLANVYGGPMFWPFNRAKEVMQFYQDFIKHAPETINGWVGYVSLPPVPLFPAELHNKTVCAVVWCYTGPMERAEEAFKPIRKFGPPVLDYVNPIPFPNLQRMFDALYPPGMQWFWKADFVKELSDQAILQHIQYASQLPTPQSTMHLYPINGVVQHIGKNETAFSYRDATWAEVIVGVSPDPKKKDLITQWARDYWAALHPYSAGGAYINFMMDEGSDRIKATYRDNYDRLARIKAKYDPDNFFRVNQNITPSA